MNCQFCGTPLPDSSRRDRRWCNNKCSALASYYRRRDGIPNSPSWKRPALESDDPVVLAAVQHVTQLSQLHGWSPTTINSTVDGLWVVLADLSAGDRVQLTDLRARMPRRSSVPRVAEVLTAMDLLNDDSTLAVRSWIDRCADELPAGFAEVIRAWLLVLLDGDRRARPRSPDSLYAYYKFVRPVIETWVADHAHLREVTATDVTAALEPLRGNRRRCTIVALRSLFRFAKKRGLVFADPTTRFKAERIALELLPLTDNEIHGIEQAATNPEQRLIVALAAVHAARTSTIRHLMLDDLDLPNQRITLAGHNQRLGELPLNALRAWLRHRRATWPHSPNRYVLICGRTALGTKPVTHPYIHSRMRALSVGVDRIRRDRILHEALTSGADPLHLSLVFNLSLSTTSRYADMAQRLLDDQLEQHTSEH